MGAGQQGPLDYVEDVPPLRREVAWLRDALHAIRDEIKLRTPVPPEALPLAVVIDRMAKTGLDGPR